METFRPWPATVIRSYYEHPPDSGYLCVDVGDKVSVLCAQAPGAMSLLTFLRVLSICVRCHWMLPAQWFKNAHGCGVTSFNTSVHQPRRFLFGILCIIIFRNFSYSILLLPSSCTSEIMFWISSCFGSKPSARIAAFTFSGSIEPQLSVSKRSNVSLISSTQSSHTVSEHDKACGASRSSVVAAVAPSISWGLASEHSWQMPVGAPISWSMAQNPGQIKC